ncbi:hypothetical protein ACFQZI_10420 [Mucilaginibacter lutimaris]|uniref:Uncharacterized protein n=1 Tax=Mucilaginibacter lutimaris TaxID=931629 RepID=A0ABW2ZGH9_9SPHI
MNVFKLFKRQEKQPFAAETNEILLNSDTEGILLPEIKEDVFIEHIANKPSENNSHFFTESPTSQMDNTTNSVADNNIALLYAFLDRNHEAKGYDDALLNPDSSHLAQNLDALKNDLVRTINKVKTFYEDFIQETEYHILSRGRSGMVDIVEELEMKKSIAAGHMAKLTVIEDNTAKGEGDCKGILLSYTRGFKNGLAAISHHNILIKRF